MADSLSSKVQREKGKSPGWAVVACKQRQKQDIEPECSVDPYPPISNSSSTKRDLVANHGTPMRPFSSVVQASMNFPSLSDSSKIKTLPDNSSKDPSDQITVETHAHSVENLKNAHSWANDSLIEDILAAVNNNEERASALLQDMVSSDSKKEQVLLGPSSVRRDHLLDENKKCLCESISPGYKLVDGAQRELQLPSMFSAPIEPEWVENDVYLSLRKDATRTMRVASQHSRAANNAFMGGDHFSAHQLSQKARAEWMEAEKLNAKAAEEILSIGNSNNDMWKLDLHGLHAAEAVDALKKHLYRIESQTLINRSASSDGIDKLAAGVVRSPSLESVSQVDMVVQASKQYALRRQRQAVLHVITGTGNHSRGQAALPTAVRSFLIEDGYRFDDVRPGVVAVRPKFRNV